ncbi:MAG: shikimate dehydrogenase [Bdellovibrio sp.]|nr:shikimate dehydrogenase [Methylotenera sp.]
MTDKYDKPLNIDRYAVLGNPIAHSKSPQIHAAFAKQTGQPINYEAILAPIDGFAASIKNLIAQGYKGANVTVPFKFEAFNLCDELTERATSAGAVNTLSFNQNKIIGDNTDGVGLARDLTLNYSYALKGARILLLGAGGAAQGVMLPLINAEPASITIANRNLEKAQFMIQKIAAQHAVCNLAVSNYENLQSKFDVIINATSIGLSDTILPISNTIFAKNCLAYDMMYGRETPFMAKARSTGAQVADGLGMLVEQAAEAFYVWRGVRPETAPVIKMMSTY